MADVKKIATRDSYGNTLKELEMCIRDRLYTTSITTPMPAAWRAAIISRHSRIRTSPRVGSVE